MNSAPAPNAHDLTDQHAANAVDERTERRLLRQRAAQLEKMLVDEIRRLPADGRFVEVSPAHPAFHDPSVKLKPQRAWKSRHFVAQLYDEKSEGTARISVQRALAIPAIRQSRRDLRAITWDELMEVKRQLGYGAVWALEIYPADDQAFVTYPMRHLWLVGSPPPFGWRRELQAQSPHSHALEGEETKDAATRPHPIELDDL